MIVEDEAPIRALLGHLVRRRDYDVLEAASCAEVRALASGHSFNLVLCNMRLHNGNGASVFRWLRKSP